MKAKSSRGMCRTGCPELAPEPAASDAEPTSEDVVDDSDFTWMTDEALASAESQTEQIDPEFTWMAEEPDSTSEFETEAISSEAGVDDSWLSELEPEAESAAQPEEETEAEPVTADDLGWLSELELEPEAAESNQHLRKNRSRKQSPQMISAGWQNWILKRKPEPKRRKRSRRTISRG